MIKYREGLEHETRKIILSIKPEFSDKIFSGEKKYEFRKQKPKRAVELVYVYESHRSKRIVGWFSVRRIISGSPEEIWGKCGEAGGIRKEDFFRYCGDKKIIHAFQIVRTHRFDNPVNPANFDPSFTPPQNFCYFV